MKPKSETKISIGALIEKELRQQERSVSWFARHLACDRRNIYRIFKKDCIDTDLLIRISKILEHDFFADISKATLDSSKIDENKFK